MNRAPGAESEKPLGDCHPGEEEEEADCKPEFETKAPPGNFRLWRSRGAGWSLLWIHDHLLANALLIAFGDTKDPFIPPDVH
jgi:hypothetical protein